MNAIPDILEIPDVIPEIPEIPVPEIPEIPSPRIPGVQRFIGVDSETYLIAPGRLAPPLVCISTAERVGQGFATSIFLRQEGLDFYRKMLADPDVVLVIHNAPFDLGVACAEDSTLVPLVFQAYREHRIRCTIVRQKLIDIAAGMRKFRRSTVNGQQVVSKSNYGLADLVYLYYDEHLEKKDTWRLSYAFLDGILVECWPENAREYAIRDAVEHLRVYEMQQQVIDAAKQVWNGLPNQVEQQCAAFALHLMSMWGVRAEATAVEHFISHCRVEIDKMHCDLAGTGIFKMAYKCGGRKCEYRADEFWQACPKCGAVKCKPNPEAGVRSMAEIRARVVASCARKQVSVPMTQPSQMYPDGQVQTDKEALESTDDVALHVLAAQMTFEKHLGQWGPVCLAAVQRPVCARYEVLVETGRTACSGSEGQEGTNFQNPPRKGDVRPCFIPRPGWVFCSTDADTIELRAHAQNCIEMVGWSKMAEALWDQHKNGGPDLHLRLAASLLGIDPYEALALKLAGDLEITLARQFAKIPNFGFPGGLGAETMVLYAAAQLDKATHQKWFGTERMEQIARATHYRKVWFETWKENEFYFKIVGKMIDRDSGEGMIQQRMSERIRGGTRFTAAANGFFQGRVADAMKEVLFNLAEECYAGRCTTTHLHGGSALCTFEGRSVLLGSRPVMFLHDEPIVEHPEDGSESDRAERQREIVVESLSRWMPDVPCTSSAVLMRRWQKNAEVLKVNGKLVPVKPEKVQGADGKVKVKWVEDKRAA